MKNSLAPILTVVLTLALPWIVQGQEAGAPTYKDGDWWQFKTELKSGSQSSSCRSQHPEYIVKIEEGKATAYKVQPASQEEINCDELIYASLGTPGDISERLHFPLHAGKEWRKRIGRRLGPKMRWSQQHYKVHTWEKIETPKGILEAFKITRSYTFRTSRGERTWSETYYYSPEVKAIIQLDSKSPTNSTRAMLVDFNVSN